MKPGITGLAQVALGYTGRPTVDSEVVPFMDSLTNPFKVAGADGALADDMRMKLLYDLAYCASLEDFRTFLRTELSILLRTPLVMLRGPGSVTRSSPGDAPIVDAGAVAQPRDAHQIDHRLAVLQQAAQLLELGRAVARR